MKKILALLLCMSMMMALCACGGTTIESYENNEAAETAETAEAAETTEAADIAETVEAIGLTDFSGPCYDAYPGDMVVGTVNGEDVTWMEYFYWMNYYVQYVQQLAAAYGVTLTGWEANEVSSSDTNAQVIQINVEYAVMQHHVVMTKAAELGVTLNDEDMASVEEVFALNADAAVGDGDGVATEEELAGFETYLAEQNVDREFFDYLTEVTLLADKIFVEIYGTAGETYPDEDVAAFVTDNGLMGAKHILLLTLDMTTGEALTEDEIAAQKALAEDLLSQLQAAGDQTAMIELFDQLTAEYTEDTGYAAYPEGYIFGEGEMVTEFEDAVKALDENYGLSEVVESSYGYHIILRIPVDPAASLGTDSYGNDISLRNYAASAAFNSDMETWMTEASVVWNEDFQTVDVAAIFG